MVNVMSLYSFSLFIEKKNCVNDLYEYVIVVFKGTIRTDWIRMRVVPLDRPWKDINRYKFFIFYLWSYLIRVLRCFMQKWIQPPPCLCKSWFACAQTETFSAKPCSKNVGRHQLVFGLRLMSKEFQHPAIQTKIEQLFDIFFHQIKVLHSLGRQDSMQTAKQAGSWIRFCMKRFFQIFRSEIKKSKTYSGWCPFQGLSNSTTLMKITYGMARRYL